MIELKLLLLLTVANGAPVIARRLMGGVLAQPVDGGRLFPDGRRIFGRSKTWRGLITAVVITALVAYLLQMGWVLGAAFGLLAMLGDLLSSFIKRRLGIPASGMALGLDQIPESFLPLWACMSVLDLSWPQIAAIVAVFLVGELLLSRVLFKLHIRDRPY